MCISLLFLVHILSVSEQEPKLTFASNVIFRTSFTVFGDYLYFQSFSSPFAFGLTLKSMYKYATGIYCSCLNDYIASKTVNFLFVTVTKGSDRQLHRPICIRVRTNEGESVEWEQVVVHTKYRSCLIICPPAYIRMRLGQPKTVRHNGKANMISSGNTEIYMRTNYVFNLAIGMILYLLIRSPHIFPFSLWAFVLMLDWPVSTVVASKSISIQNEIPGFLHTNIGHTIYRSPHTYWPLITN